MTNAERVLGHIRRHPGRDDDQIAAALKIEPRQTVNEICRRLAEAGVIRRGPGPSGKTVNTAVDWAAGTDRARASAGVVEPDFEGQLTPAAPGRRPLTVARLVDRGFIPAANWKLATDGRLTTDRALPKTRGVYAFVIDNAARYVGVALMGLAKRLRFYARPGATQRTSQRLNQTIIRELTNGEAIAIYTATPPDLSWNGLPVNGAAGLEIGLIETFDLPWNIRGVRRGGFS